MTEALGSFAKILSRPFACPVQGRYQSSFFHATLWLPSCIGLNYHGQVGLGAGGDRARDDYFVVA